MAVDGLQKRERVMDLGIAVVAFLVASAAAYLWGHWHIATVWVLFVLFAGIIGAGTAWIAARQGRTRSEILGWFAAALFLTVFALLAVVILRPRRTS